jgi:molecular chaperone DnaJ
MVTRLQETFIGSIRTSTTCPSCGGAGKTIKTPCEKCKGRGLEVVDAEVLVTVPPGIEDGMTLRVSGRGSDGVGAGAPGDLYVVVHVATDRKFVRNGPDLYTSLALTFPQVALGDRVKVQGLTDELELVVKPGTQPGHEFRFKGEGVPRLHGGARGSLVVRVDVSVPSKSSEQEAELLRQYAQASGGPVPSGEEPGILGSIFGKKRKK